MRERSFGRPLVPLLVVSIFLAAAVQAQTPPCGVPPGGQPWGCGLQDPPSIERNKDNVLDTSLVIRERDMWVPVWTDKLCKGTYKVCTTNDDCTDTPDRICVDAETCPADNGKVCSFYTDIFDKRHTNCTDEAECVKTWGWQMQHLRLYGNPKDPSKTIDPKNPDDPNIRWGYPGPILRARATTLKDPTLPPDKTSVVTPGTRIKVKLYNYLPATQTYKEATEECNPATYNACTDDRDAVKLYCTGNKELTCKQDSDCEPYDGFCQPLVCTTPSECPRTGSRRVDCKPTPIPQEHPNCFHGNNVTNLHLHGTHVSPQPHQDFVLLSLFPFGSKDVPTGNPNYAVGYYEVDVNPLPWNQAPGTHWYHPHKHGSTSLQVLGGMAGALIIEGAFDDWLKGFYAGKLVDRIMAIQQISGRSNFFNPGTPNYPPQVLLNGSATPVIKMDPGEIQRWRFVAGTTQAASALEIGFDPRIKDVRQIAQDGIQFASQNYDRQPLLEREGTYIKFRLAPGNRADFLVKAPDAPGIYTVNRRIFLPKLAGRVEALFNKDTEKMAERVPPTQVQAGRPPFDQSRNPLLFTIQVTGTPHSMSFPVTKDWPGTPYYLQDLKQPGTAPTEIAFSMDGDAGSPLSKFYINHSQYKSCCAGVTMKLGTTQDWLVSNVLGKHSTFLLAHPFHIHTNPFQVIRNGGRTFKPPYIWQDTIALPAEAGDNNEVLLRQRYDDYTGGYVIHCHFLGHEDRGMMWNVQTVCDKPGIPGFGQPQSSGGADNCTTSPPLKNALPACTADPNQCKAGH
jgi:FtsP/CotA-like multicopper oxidase with cupredoxin domain